MTTTPALSILIPTWNNLPYLKFCLDSLRRNTRTLPQVVIHINDGSDGTLEWVRAQGLDYTHTAQNSGVCKAMNLARTKATGRYLMYLNDDMYVCPELDSRLLARAAQLEASGNDCFMISGTMIEARDSGNACTVNADFGHSPETFREADLLASLPRIERADWCGSTWPPLMMSSRNWDIVGGFSIEFSPGMYSDPDLSMKMWMLGCRTYLGVGNALAYHFPSRSTGRIRHNRGRVQFLRKWGITSKTFDRYMLRRGMPYQGSLGEPDSEGGFAFKRWLDGVKLRVLS
ncbi:MAG: glycosyltransferase family 2 protein [Stenotrophobium sp.]